MGKVLQCPRPNVPYMPKGFSGIKRDQAGPSGTKRDYARTQVGVPPLGFDFACANSPRTAGAARTLAGILGTSQNSGKHKNNRREFGQAAPARFKNIGLGPMFLRTHRRGLTESPAVAITAVANRCDLSQPSRTVASYRSE